MDTQTDWRLIMERAATIYERLGTSYIPIFNDTSFSEISERWKRWLETAAKGNDKRFTRRLEWDKLDCQALRKAMGPTRLVEGVRLPAWIDTLHAVLLLVEEEYQIVKGSGCGNEAFVHPKSPLPFEEILIPFVRVAKKQLMAKAGTSYSLLSHAAHVSFERTLLELLTSLSSQTFHFEFSAFRTFEWFSVSFVTKQYEQEKANVLYRQFVEHMYSGALAELLTDYAVLARVLCTAIINWVESTGEFLLRLQADLPDLSQWFNDGVPLKGQIAAITPSMSDPHQGGRTVIGLTFSCGRHLIYKPKSMASEAVWNTLLEWLNSHHALLPLKSLRVLDRSTYGWVEFAKAYPCLNDIEVSRYYRRFGMLVCLLYVLEATDCHMENIVACSEHPVLVDLETLLHPRHTYGSDIASTQATSLAHSQLQNSVLRTGMLPHWIVSKDKRQAYDVSGLGGVGDQETPYQVATFEQVNTDEMQLTYRTVRVMSANNVPHSKDTKHSIKDHIEEISKGFRQMYLFLLTHREELLEPAGPLEGFSHLPSRYIFRNSAIYNWILKRLRKPKYLREGIDRSIEFDLLSRALTISEEQSLFWPLIAAERQALESLDIPYFRTRADSDSIQMGEGETIKSCFTMSGYEAMLKRLQSLSLEDAEKQGEFLRAAWYSHVAGGVDFNQSLSDSRLPPDRLTSTELVEAARLIADELGKRAIRGSDGSATWMGYRYMPQAGKYQFQALDYMLFSGVSGIALFLATIERFCPGHGYGELALGALASLRKALHDPALSSQQLFARLGIGGGDGIGSIVYTLTRCGSMLENDELIADSRLAADLITKDAINRDDFLDVMAGSAGAILGLLTLYSVSGEGAWIDRAYECGRHLLIHRVKAPSGQKVWPGPAPLPLTGFAHGAAGIAYGLLRLADISGEEKFIAAAKEAIAYETSVFSAEAGNWPDFRGYKLGNKVSQYLPNWCYGAAGIGLARLGGLSVLDTPLIRKDIEFALKATITFSTDKIVDHLCCGRMGRVMLLLKAGHLLGCEDLVAQAHKMAEVVVADAKTFGEYKFFPGLPRTTYNPGMFQGSAGIGYALLRLGTPNLVPELLLWE